MQPQLEKEKEKHGADETCQYWKAPLWGGLSSLPN